MLALEQRTAGTATNLNAPLQRVAELIRKRGLIVFISDLLAPLDELEVSLGRLAAAGHEIILFQVLDPNELAFSFDQATYFQDIESERDLYLDPVTVREDYRGRFSEHNEKAEAICRNLGVAFHQLVTNQPLETALLDFIRRRSRRGKLVRRQTQSSSR